MLESIGDIICIWYGIMTAKDVCLIETQNILPATIDITF